MTWERRHVGAASVDFFTGQISGKGRPRSMVMNGHVHTYTPDRTRDAEQEVRAWYQVKYGGKWSAFRGTCHVRVRYSRELAKSNPKYWAGRADTGKPDADNVLKLVLDALNGVAWADDANVTFASVEKLDRTPHGSGCELMIDIDYYDERHMK